MKTATSDLTTEPIEWLSPKQATRLFSISRSYLYMLLKSGSIKSCCVRQRHNIRGKRLISAQSLRQFLESQPEGISR